MLNHLPFQIRLAAILGIALAALTFAAPANAASRDAVERDFRTWLEREVWPDAKAKGVSRATFQKAVGDIRLNWKLPDLAPPGSKPKPSGGGQAEFGSPAPYFSQKRLSGLASAGRARMQKWDTTLTAIEKRYGVPRRIIVAIWGRESGYGGAKIPYDAVESLATLGFMGARKKYFYPELIAALQILEEEHIGHAQLKSSWAGALGQPQFLPSKFLLYAVDFDGDGRRNIWTSVPDTLASIANYLRAHGWQPGRDWGFEAVIPTSVSCSLEGPDLGMTVADWAARGVTRVAGRKFPSGELGKTGFLLMPAGRAGPAFIATQNFYTLKYYNESDLYALFIGHLADRFYGDKPFVTDWKPVSGRFRRADVQVMQKRLIKKGYDVGGADGLVGFKTRRSIGAWQEKNGRAATCFPDSDVVKAIR